MAETYIPLSAAFDALAPFCKTCRFSVNDKNCICCPYGHTRIKLNTIPAADVRPVVHGHYIGEYDGYADGNPVYDMWYCSECGCCFEDWDEKPTYNFCPNCGADMMEKTGR